MSGGTFVPRNECPGGHFFQGDSHSSDMTRVTFVNRQLAVTSGNMNTASDDCGGTGGSSESSVNATSPIDPLAWWKLHDSRFPRISKLARKYLAIPASSAPSA